MGGWITSNLTGPFKGELGSGHWWGAVGKGFKLAVEGDVAGTAENHPKRQQGCNDRYRWPAKASFFGKTTFGRFYELLRDQLA